MPPLQRRRPALCLRYANQPALRNHAAGTIEHRQRQSRRSRIHQMPACQFQISIPPFAIARDPEWTMPPNLRRIEHITASIRATNLAHPASQPKACSPNQNPPQASGRPRASGGHAASKKPGTRPGFERGQDRQRYCFGAAAGAAGAGAAAGAAAACGSGAGLSESERR